MFGAIYIGLSGLNAYSRGLEQVSNNVTNLNTTGFRGTTVSFQNYYSNGGTGSMSYTLDGQGSGNGVGLSQSRLDFRQGELRQTDRDLDLTVDGKGFLVLLNGNETLYVRTGSFEIDKDGYIVLSGTDYRLATLDAAGRPVSVSIDSSRTSAPARTTRIKFNENLSSDAATHAVSDIKVYDAKGGLHVWKVQFTRETGADNNWKVAVTDAKGTVYAEQQLRFGVDSKPEEATRKLAFANESLGVSVELDFSEGVTSYASGSLIGLRAASVDGYGMGTVTVVGINAKGELELEYSNTQKLSLGAVAIADFRDPQALEQRSGGLFAYAGTGGLNYMNSEDVRSGKVLGKRLEASNVDLSKQFGDLILIQRGFQASSQIVSVSNDMIQQLFGIRGQG